MLFMGRLAITWTHILGGTITNIESIQLIFYIQVTSVTVSLVGFVVCWRQREKENNKLYPYGAFDDEHSEK